MATALPTESTCGDGLRIMKTTYGLIGIVALMALLAYAYIKALNGPSTEPDVAGEGLRMPSTFRRGPNPAPAVPIQGKSAIKPGLETPPDMPLMPYGSGPFLNADPNKPHEQSSESDHNVGAFVDAGGPPPALNIPQDAGHFLDADHNKPPVQSSEPDRNVGAFVDVGGPPIPQPEAAGNIQNREPVHIVPPLPIP